MLTQSVWVLGNATVAGRPAHRLPLLQPRSSNTFHVQGLQKTSYYSLPRGGVRCGASVPTAYVTQERLGLSIPEMANMGEKAGGALGVVHPPTGSWSLSILC